MHIAQVQTSCMWIKSLFTANRIKSQERDLMKAQELIFKKDRQIREEAQKFEAISATVADMRREQAAEVEQLRAQLSVEKVKVSEATDRHRLEIEEIRNEVAEKIPKLLSSAIEKVSLAILIPIA